MRLTLVTNIPAPYRVPVWNALVEEGVDLRVVFCSEREPRRNWEWPGAMRFPFAVDRSAPWKLGSRSVYASPTIYGHIKRMAPDVVLAGGFSMPALYAHGYARMHRGVGFGLFAESTIHSEHGTPTFQVALRRYLVRSADALVAASTDTKDYFSSLGADEKSIFTSLLTIDVEKFHAAAREARGRAETTRAKLGITGPVILYVGRLVPEKGLGLLFDALRTVQRDTASVTLVLVGSGPSEPELRARSKSEGLRVFFAGDQPQAELPGWYGIGDVFVFPTLSDRFGVVVAEATAAGLPIVCSKHAGAARDCVRDGINGFLVDPHDCSAVAQSLAVILSDPGLRSRMAKASQEILHKLDVRAAALELRRAAEFAMKRKRGSVENGFGASPGAARV